MGQEQRFPHLDQFAYAVVSRRWVRIGASQIYEDSIQDIRTELTEHASFALHFSAHPYACKRLGITPEKIEAEFQAADTLLLSTLGFTYRSLLKEMHELEKWLNKRKNPAQAAAKLGLECIRDKPAGSR